MVKCCTQRTGIGCLLFCCSLVIKLGQRHDAFTIVYCLMWKWVWPYVACVLVVVDVKCRAYLLYYRWLFKCLYIRQRWWRQHKLNVMSENQIVAVSRWPEELYYYIQVRQVKERQRVVSRCNCFLPSIQSAALSLEYSASLPKLLARMYKTNEMKCFHTNLIFIILLRRWFYLICASRASIDFNPPCTVDFKFLNCV